ncbi:hypothetical protein E2562_004094 [Oryza meyeriana var. granulata]|uniref:Uncharacterized protein n=1 Tax=Oryza meyeriana var. granulata TaxID=110450 RepID=A0A6G1BIZ2_9ORYZ|nr:hypothetical protein E2562_004094 [Oryza meyeriana var. granulata]
MIKGMNPKHKNLSALLPMMTPFPSFIQARSPILLDELNDDSSDSIALFTDSRPPSALAQDNGGGSRGSTSGGNGGKKGKGKTKGGGKGQSTANPPPLPVQPHWNPWQARFNSDPQPVSLNLVRVLLRAYPFPRLTWASSSKCWPRCRPRHPSYSSAHHRHIRLAALG